jgi:uncharacterized protein YigA (DUF484 family)
MGLVYLPFILKLFLEDRKMLTTIKEVINGTSKNIMNKLGIRAMIKNTAHFQERVLQRFNEEDIPQLERAIEKAFEKAIPNNKTFRYTHPAYHITVVVKKLGTNCLELVTCWKQDEEDIQYA